MDSIASQITSITIVYSTVHSGADQSKHQSSASLAFVWEIHRWPVNFPHKWPVTRKMFPFDDVIMLFLEIGCFQYPIRDIFVSDNLAPNYYQSVSPVQHPVIAYAGNEYYKYVTNCQNQPCFKPIPAYCNLFTGHVPRKYVINNQHSHAMIRVEYP